MACRVRYLNSAGIMKREIPGIDALAKAFQKEWLLYASLNCYPRAQDPMEIDALVVIDDRLLLLELKDWNGKLTQRGDQWFINGKSRGRSAVIVADEKAKKLKAVIRAEIPHLKDIWVESRVILTASATRDQIADNEKRFVWTLSEACSIADPNKKSSLLERRKSGLLKAYQFEGEFDRLTNNAKLFQPLEADWGGYRVSEANVVVHPQGVWKEHRAERNGEARMKALLRVWSFDRLPPGLNSPDRRKLIAEREIRAYAHLTALESPLIERNAVFRDIGPCPDEILTNHFQLRALLADWTTWDRYLEKYREDLDSSDRVCLATTLLSLISDLHRSSVAHRDLGPRSIWVGSTSKMALNGFMCCQLPDEESVEDWLPILKGYAPSIPEDTHSNTKSSAKQRDVFLAGLLVANALGVELEILSGTIVPFNLSPNFQSLQSWLDKALSPDPNSRFPDVVEMTDEFAALTESFGTETVDQAILDKYETSLIPYVDWPVKTFYVKDSRRTVYLSTLPDQSEVVVKVWPGIRRNVNAATDLALIRLFESASRVLANPIQGVPHVIKIGLSSIGPFVVYKHENGKHLNEICAFSVEETLIASCKLLSIVTSLHDLGCEHGDIAAKNIIYESTTKCLYLLDAFDITPVGDGFIRTPALCPNNWEKLNQQCLDRYAALKVVLEMLRSCNNPLLDKLIVGINSELERPIVETLEVSLTMLRHAVESLQTPPQTKFLITHPHAQEGFFLPDDGGYFLTQRALGKNASQYFLTGIDQELVLSTQDGVLTSSNFVKTHFSKLANVSHFGIKIRIEVNVSNGPEDGILQLFDFLKTLNESVTQVSHEHGVKSGASFNVPLHWERLLDLEINDRLEVEIVEEIFSGQGVGIYTIKGQNQLLDFDPESSIDVYSSSKKIGELEQGASDSTNTLAIRNQNRRLKPGDILSLVDRREQTSIDRRSKAVRNILDDKAAIPRLIDYFSPQSDKERIDYGVDIQEETLSKYGLNSCQEEAFRNVLRYGPVGLLQGPPGTGKTRFIASLVHWLMTEGGARRVLIASQSHEAVNNAIESLVSLYKRRGAKPNLLRIGSKGITERIRPFHSAELRERYRIRFEAAMKHKVSLLATEKGVSRRFTSDVLEIDEKLGGPARHCNRLRKLAEDSTETTVIERNRYATELRRAETAFRSAAANTVGIEIDVTQPMEELDAAFKTLLVKHPTSSEADLAIVLKILELAKDWANSMGSKSRNFDEFLAKTRGVVTATCVGVGETKIRIESSLFDWVIVDEAARCTSSELAVPIQLGRRVLLVGDHFQLMPMVKRNLLEGLQEEFPSVKPEDLIRSDFERSFLSPYGSHVGRRLTEQYRMHPYICELVSKCFYEKNEVTLTTSAFRRPALEIQSEVPPFLDKPICWIDTSASPNAHEFQPNHSTTFYNDAEVDAIIKILDKISLQVNLVDAMTKCDEETPIGVICMYSGQKRRLELVCARHAWEPHFRKLIRVDTVDAYQGKENAIVIVSLVRSNPNRDPGHVRIENRCNVALSRARERLIIVGSCKMWSSLNDQNPIRRTLNHIRSNVSAAVVISAETI